MRTEARTMLAVAVLALGTSDLSGQGGPPATPQGFITAKEFLDIGGTAISSLTGHPRFPDNPDVIAFPIYLEWPQSDPADINTTPPTDVKNNYGVQIIGFFYPATTGEYTFYLASDDNSVLYLSTDATAANKKLIAQETAWSDPRQYFVSGGNSTLTAKDSSQFTGTEWPTKNPAGGAAISLIANQPYYIEALSKEGGGGDNLSVSIDGLTPIPGQFLSSDRSQGPLTIVQHPQSQSVDERGSVTFRVIANGTPPYTYQWRKDNADIPGATNIAYTISSAAVADNGAKFSVVVTGAEGSAPSNEAVLTVIPDTVPPMILSAKGNPSLTEVVLTFSEAVTGASAETASNYAIASTGGPLAVTAASLAPGGTAVTLTTVQQTLGTKYTVTVNNIQDTAAAPNTIAANSKVVFFPKGPLVEQGGFIVFEAESYDRNLDGLWVPDASRGTPSGGVSMVVPNGAGGNESGTRLEYDVEFAQAGTYRVWYRASGDNGNDDSSWFHIDGGRPPERAAGNQASMTGFQPQSDFVWRSDAQEAPDPFTVEIPSQGLHVVGLARREDGSFFDKFILTTDTAYTPTGLGPPETREGLPAAPTVALTAPTSGQEFTTGADIPLSATATGDLGLAIVRVEFTANGTPVGEATASPFSVTWNDVPDGIYAIRATATDEIGVSNTSDLVVIEVGPAPTTARIAWVSFHPADDTPSNDAATAGFTQAADVAYTNLLETNGHQVTRVVTSGTPDAPFLNAFDVVIISRSVPSGDYELASETAAWNGVTAPMMILGGYVLRSNRLGFTTGTTIPDTGGQVRLEVLEPTHPIFDGIPLDAGNIMVNPYADAVSFNGTVQRGISVNTNPIAGNGTVLATIATAGDPAFGGLMIGEWQVGATLGNASADTLGGHRLVLLTGSREHDGLTSQGAGIYDLNPDGARMFLNAVNYMAGTQPGTPPTISLTRTPTGISIEFTGTLQSSATLAAPWTDVPNATSPHPVTITGGHQFYRARQ